MNPIRIFVFAVFAMLPTLGLANTDPEDRKAAIEKGPDFGFTPDEYAERFNTHLDLIGLPATLDASIDNEDVGAQAVFSTVFMDTVSLTGTAKPESRLVNGLIVNGAGNGTPESGQLILLWFASAMAALDANGYPDDYLGHVLSLLESMETSPDSVGSAVIGNVSYHISNSPLTGVMLAADPVQ